MDVIIENLPNETKTIIQCYKVSLETIMKKDLEIKLKEKDLEMKLKENELEMQLKNLKYEYALNNWYNLKVKTKLSIRSFIELFENRRLNTWQGLTRRQKYINFASELHIINDVRSSDFTPEDFAETVVNFFQNMSRTAHPIFQSGDTLIIREDFLSESEWRVLSLLWKLYPLPVGKLKKTKTEWVTA